MRRYAIWGVMAMSIIFSRCSEEKSETPALALTAPAEAFVTLLAQEDYAGVVATFNEKMRQVMPEDKVREAWQAIQSQVGGFQKQLGVRQTKEQGFNVVYVTCQFEKRKIDIKIVYDGSRQVAGLWFQ